MVARRPVIYLDSSLVLAYVLTERRAPPAAIWDEPLTSSRLLEYETWVRLHARGFADDYGEHLSAILRRVALVELSSLALARALDPFPIPVRTLDALHLATMSYLRKLGQKFTLASYDERLLAAARKLNIAVWSAEEQ